MNVSSGASSTTTTAYPRRAGRDHAVRCPVLVLDQHRHYGRGCGRRWRSGRLFGAVRAVWPRLVRWCCRPRDSPPNAEAPGDLCSRTRRSVSAPRAAALRCFCPRSLTITQARPLVRCTNRRTTRWPPPLRPIDNFVAIGFPAPAAASQQEAATSCLRPVATYRRPPPPARLINLRAHFSFCSRPHEDAE